MGSFGGHILPGSFFLLFGIWWTYSMFSRYFKFLAKRRLNNRSAYYECTATYQCSCLPNVPIEGYCKIIASCIGIIAEFATAFKDGKFEHIGNAQHMTMFLFFGINGIIDVLVFYGFPLPDGSEYMSLCLATFMEGFLFSFHLHGRTPLDIHIHTLLIIGVFASTISVIIEWRFRHNMLSSFFRNMCAILQGSWFYQVGFILYPPLPGSEMPDEHSHRYIMFITAVFCWHIAAIILLMAIIGYCFYLNYRSFIKEDISAVRQLSDSYSDVKYTNIENDVKLELLTSKANGIVLNNNNTNQRKHSLDDSSDD